MAVKRKHKEMSDLTVLVTSSEVESVHIRALMCDVYYPIVYTFVFLQQKFGQLTFGMFDIFAARCSFRDTQNIAVAVMFDALIIGS